MGLEGVNLYLESVDEDGEDIVQYGGFSLVRNGSDIDLLSVYCQNYLPIVNNKWDYLPLLLVAGEAPVLVSLGGGRIFFKHHVLGDHHEVI